MSSNLEKSRKILIVMPDQDQRAKARSLIASHLSSCQFFEASSGAEGCSKINNDVPDIVFVDNNLPIMKTEKFVEWIFGEKKAEKMAVIWLKTIPEQENFIDNIVTGQLQFLENPFEERSLSQVLSRAMNFLVVTNNHSDYKLKFLAPGDQLISEGDFDTLVYLVSHGELEAIVFKDGKRISLGKIQAGEFVGEMAYINHEKRSADVFAVSDCELIEFPSDKLDFLLFQKPSWAKALLKTLSRRLKQTNERLS